MNQFWLLEITRFSPVKELNRLIHWGHFSSARRFIRFCVVSSLVKLGFMDDVTVWRDEYCGRGCLHNSTSQCGDRPSSQYRQVRNNNGGLHSNSLSSPLADFVRVVKSEMMLLGAPVTKGKTQDKAITDKIEQLSRAIDRLSLLNAHDALVILKNSLAMHV